MTVDKSSEKISSMFNKLAVEYDKNNNLISLGLHNIIKYLAVKSLYLKDDSTVYDLCCGTGDIASLVLKINSSTDVTGFDFSDDMLNIAKKKHKNINFIKSDITNLPVADYSADAVTIGFGLRNVENRKDAIREIYRILNSNGKILHLDFGKHNIFSDFFDKIVMLLIKIFISDKEAYLYLLNSKSEFPEPAQLVEEFKREGFKLLNRRDYLFGIISSQIFTK